MDDQALGGKAGGETAVETLREVSRGRLFGMSLFWLAVNLHWSALLVAVIPHEVARIHPEGHAWILSVILGVGAVVALVLPPFIGAYSDRCAHPWGRRRPFMAAGTLINVGGLVLMYLAGQNTVIGLYLVAYLVIQLGNNLATAAYSGVIPDLVPSQQRGIASGWMAGMTQTGNILGAVGGGLLVQRGLTGTVYGSIAVSLMVLLTVTCVAVRERPLVRHVPYPSLVHIVKSFWIDPRKYPNFAWVWFTRFLFTAGMWMVQPYIQYYLRDVIGSPRPAEDAGRIIGVALVGAAITGVLGGSISDRVGRKKVVYVANGLMAAISLGFMVVHTMPAVYVVAIAYGLAFGAYYSVDWALGCDVLPRREDAGKDMGVWHIAMVLPQSLAPFMSGLLLTLGGATAVAGSDVPRYSSSGYLMLFIVAATLLTLSAVLLRNVKGIR